MDEEEIKAMNECKILMICLYDYMSIEKARFYCNQYKIILELIEKQQKEIEKLKKDIRHIRDKAEVMDYYSLNDVIDDLTKLIGE